MVNSHSHGPDPTDPAVIDVHDFRSAGSMKRISRRVPAAADLGNAVITVPEGSPIEVDLLLEALRAPPKSRLAEEAKIGQGGMGTISIVRDRALSRRVAKKAIHHGLLADDNLVRMFLREARVNAALDHPHIVPVYDVGEQEDGCLYFTMKLVQGQPLVEIAARMGVGVSSVSTYRRRVLDKLECSSNAELIRIMQP